MILGSELYEKLHGLSFLQRIAFSASCSERLFSNYIAFVNEANWGEPHVLRKALDTVWENLETGTISPRDLSGLIEECDEVIPDTEDFETPMVSYALDAGTAVVGTLQLWESGDLMRAVEIAGFARDTVYMALSVQGLDDTEMERHPWMIRELAKQEADIRILANSQSHSIEVVLRLRYGWKSQNNGLSNIDL
ncbi:MAG: DUF416 family protein [Rhizobium sp.]|nr:MAG: DUF416 family protein [Rhizobium sp.]